MTLVSVKARGVVVVNGAMNFNVENWSQISLGKGGANGRSHNFVEGNWNTININPDGLAINFVQEGWINLIEGSNISYESAQVLYNKENPELWFGLQASDLSRRKPFTPTLDSSTYSISNYHVGNKTDPLKYQLYSENVEDNGGIYIKQNRIEKE